MDIRNYFEKKINLPVEIVNKITINATPSFAYLPALKKVHNLIRDFAEDYDDNFNMGVCAWNRHMREEVNRENNLLKHLKEQELQEEALEQGHCCFANMVDVPCDCCPSIRESYREMHNEDREERQRYGRYF